MSPRRPHLRNRKNIKAPKRLEDEYDITSPIRQESLEEGSEQASSSELEEEIYQSPKPRTPKSKKPPVYCGKVIEFNPNLPPAAFPTLDHPDYVHNGGNIAVNLGSTLTRPESQELAGFEAINSDSLGRDRHAEKSHLRESLPTLVSTTADSALRSSSSLMQRSDTRQKQARGNMPLGMYGGLTDSGPQNPIWASNMARMEEAGRMSDLDRIMLEMETSDEEDTAATRPSKISRKGSTGKYPAWDDLSVAHKLDLADTVAEIYPDPAQVMHQLRLNPSQKEELVELLVQRQDRAAKEEANQQRLLKQTKECLLQGEPLPQSKFHHMVEESFYGDIHEDHHIQTNLMELKKARAYLKSCGFDPALADGNWDIPSISSNVACGTEPKEPAQSNPEANTAAQDPPSPSETEFSQRPALSTPSQESPHLPELNPDPVQQRRQTEELRSQHRLNTPTHMQRSPSAASSSAPVQPHRVAPHPSNGHQSSSSNLRSVYEKGVMRAAQQQPQSSSHRPAVQSNNAATLSNTDRPKASAAASPYTPPTNPQEGNLLPVPGGSHTLAHNGGSPVAQANQRHQSVTDSNAGTSAPHGNGGIIGNVGDSINKKKRKKKNAT